VRYVVVLLSLSLLPGCGKAKPKPDESKAKDIIAVVLKYESTAGAISLHDSRNAGAADTTKHGWDVVETVMTNNAVGVVGKADALKAPTIAKTACGKEVETAYRKYIRIKVQHFKKWLAWWRKHKAEIGKLYKGRSYSQAVELCRKKRNCAAEPMELTSYLLINKVGCPSNYFRCKISGSSANCNFGRIQGWIKKYQYRKPDREKLIIKSSGRVYGG